MGNKLTWKFSPSIVEQYFGKNNCEKGMLVSGMNAEDRKQLGWTPEKTENSTAAAAGEKWEDEVLDIIEAHNIACRRKNKSIEYGKWSEDETVELLKELQNNSDNGNYEEVYLYQISLSVNHSFIKLYLDYLCDDKIIKDQNGISYEEDAFRIVFSRCFPDLIRANWVGDRWVLSVVDCKLSKKPKLEHKLQVGLYTWILQKKIEEWQSERGLKECFSVNSEKAYIWNKGKTEETEFDLAEVYPFLGNFMSNILKGIFDKIRSANNAEELNRSLCYSISQKCEWCDNFSNCKKWCAENEPMVLVPYESRYAQKFLRDLSESVKTANILKIDEFKAYFDIPGNDDALRQNVFWKRFLNDKESSLEMLELALTDLDKKQNDFRQRSSASLEMPSFEKVQMVITAQKDEATDNVYIYGIRVAVWKECLFVTNLKECLKEYSTGSGLKEELKKLVNVTCTGDIYTDLKQPDKGSFSDVTITITAKEREAASFDMAEDIFITILHGILSNVDKYNATRQESDWKDLISVQAYVMDNYERDNIEEMLYETLANRKSLLMKERIFDLLFWLQGESLVESEIDGRPDETVSFPIVVMTSVLNRLYTFPSLVANNLNGVAGYLSKGLYASVDNYRAINNPYFVNKLSNVLKNDCINMYWDNKDAKKLNELEAHIMHRLEVENKIITAIRYENNAVCHDNFKRAKTYAKAFRFVDRSNNGDTLLGQLEFEAKYESMLQFVKNRVIRGLDIEQAIQEGKIIEAECIKANRQFVRDKHGQLKKDRNGNFIYEYDCDYVVINAKEMFDDDKFSCVFCEKNDKNIAAVRTLIDVETKVYPDNNCVVKKGCEIVMPKVKSMVIERTHGKIMISAKFTEAMDRQKNLLNWIPAVVGKRYLIFDFSNDFNTNKNIAAIKQIPLVQNASRFVEYLDRVEAFYSSTGEYYSLDKRQIDSLATINGMTFSVSQEKAMEHLYENNIALLLGPPGTGKTDFISRALLVLCEIYRQKGKALRVLISANSHSAIENVLFAVEKKKKAAMKTMDIYKAERFDDGTENDKGDVKILDEEKLQKIMNSSTDNPFIVGATVWTTHKWLCKKGGKTSREIPKNDFDVIVLDEASQVRLVDAVIPFTYSNKQTRFLIVGDENQLSPIIQGEYDKEIDEPFRFESVFRYLSDYSYYYNKVNARKLNYKKILTENFRMNEILVRYPEQEIYKSGYKSFNNIIATQKLNYKVQPEVYLGNITSASSVIENNVSDTLKTILDEKYPLVLCMVCGKSQVEVLEKEIKWITRITRCLENCLDAQTQREFWGSSTEEGLFGIIAPHHEHISRIKDALTEMPRDGFCAPWGNENREDVYVGTVDKLQGKEREAIIVSYGIGDIERAIGEGEFIYSRNRLNVSLTRGKKKTIVFLTEALLEFPIEALGIDNKEILEGINFICDFKKFMSNAEKDTGVEAMKFESDVDGTSIAIFRKKVN